ncbi:MAG: glycerophosphodiester phosphodiesterase [Bacteroidia bacterium]|jgi:glycerophosphoryl diester phosphodiesterase|nr:glycerophosphodiester phosphodiesterase [Bacteroidia bacterium]
MAPVPKPVAVIPPAPTMDTVPNYLGHRGSGADAWSGKDTALPQENTYDAIVLGSELLDGAEMDIQMSADGTIWLWHDDKINAALPQSELSVPCLTDSEVLAYLAPGKKINTLHSVLVWLSQHPKKVFSLDVKGYFTSCSTLNSDNYFDRMTDSLKAMLTKYNLTDRVLVETDYQNFLDFMKNKLPAVETYLLAYSDLNTAINTVLNKGYKGVSMNFSDSSLTVKNTKRLRENGLKIQLWSFYSETAINSVLPFKPNYIQTGLIK